MLPTAAQPTSLLDGLLTRDPRVQYPTVLPLGVLTEPDPAGSLLSEQRTVLAMPELARGLIEGVTAPQQVRQGKLDPMTGAMLTAGAAPVGGLLARAPAGAVGMNVFHGTPHKFAPEPDFPQGRPRLDKMGTGEGAQVFGPGFYSAEQRAVAEEYKKALSRGQPQVSYKGKLLSEDYGIDFFEKGFTYEDSLARQIARNRSNPAQREEYRQALIDQAKRKQSQINPDDGDLEKRIYDSYQNEIDALGEINVDDIATLTPGNLYKLDIPDADAAKMLDYDISLRSQPDQAQPILQKYADLLGVAETADFGSFLESLKQSRRYYQFFDEMREAGVPGLRYFDQQSRGARIKGLSPERTRNFVVWDQDVLDRTQILQRNDEMLSANPAPAAIPGLLMGNPAMTQQQMQSLLADPYGA